MAGILKREPLLDGRHEDNLGYVNSVDKAYELIAEFETGLTTKVSGTLVCMYICIYIGGSIKIHSPNLTANTNVES